ncbi:unnamed protein product [Mesocestoides corti]|uniref:Endonuclease III homolog n=1 Tax=Mesocestoides corti TaxID=53468 RepID=A0A0R3UJJ4_MESCO|nr:unnamed protein product [Mesocestoides corti]
MKRASKRTGTKSCGDIEDLAKLPSWQPPKWYATLENIQRMRVRRNAPVDTMGCDQLADERADPKTFRLQTLLSLMISSQTKDGATAGAIERLKEHNVAHLAALRKLPEQKLAQLLYPVSFYKTKAKNIKKVCEILASDFDGDIPHNLKDLLSLPGVGPKMAHLAMQCAWHEVTGIGVDTHVHRIANRIRWVQKPTKTPEETRIALESWLPRDLWGDVNHLLVGFGQQICLPVNPRCFACINSPICPSARKSPQAPDADSVESGPRKVARRSAAKK